MTLAIKIVNGYTGTVWTGGGEISVKGLSCDRRRVGGGLRPFVGGGAGDLKGAKSEFTTI